MILCRCWKYRDTQSSSCIKRSQPPQLLRCSELRVPDLSHRPYLLRLQKSLLLILLLRFLLSLLNTDLLAPPLRFDPSGALSLAGATVSIGALLSAFALRSEPLLPPSNALNAPSLLWVLYCALHVALISDFFGVRFFDLIGFVRVKLINN